MSILQRAAETVAGAEASLRGLIAEAAAIGDYVSVETLATWASTLNSICAQDRQVTGEAIELPTPINGKPASATEVNSAKRARRRSYPVFAKSGETLVKIAWSKSSKSEYQHKSPRFVASKLVEALARIGKKGSVVAMEKVLPLKAEDGSAVPDYQVYVSLAWFRHIGAVKQNGRQGYTIKNPGQLLGLVEAAWAELPES